jgi:hypothetical protein
MSDGRKDVRVGIHEGKYEIEKDLPGVSAPSERAQTESESVGSRLVVELVMGVPYVTHLGTLPELTAACVWRA